MKMKTWKKDNTHYYSKVIVNGKTIGIRKSPKNLKFDEITKELKEIIAITKTIMNKK